MRTAHFLRHIRGCTRQHFLISSMTAVAGSMLVGCGGAATGSILSLSRDPLSRPGANPAPAALPPNPALGGLSIQLPFKPGAGLDPITISDFNGNVGRAVIDGSGTGNGSPLFFEVDTAFMDGEYRSVSGAMFNGTFVFV